MGKNKSQKKDAEQIGHLKPHFVPFDGNFEQSHADPAQDDPSAGLEAEDQKRVVAAVLYHLIFMPPEQKWVFKAMHFNPDDPDPDEGAQAARLGMDPVLFKQHYQAACIFLRRALTTAPLAERPPPAMHIKP